MREEIEGYEGLYAVDEDGNVWSLKHKPPQKMKPQVSTGGYLKVMLYKNGKGKGHYVHRLVAGAFLSKREGANVVNHIDANPGNCSIKNLEWVNQIDNIAHSRKLGNQNKDRAVRIIFEDGRIEFFTNMREASAKVFDKPLALRGQFRRKGTPFIYGGVTVEVE